MKIAGVAIGRSLIDDRLVNLPISPLMWDIVQGQKMHFCDMRKLDQSIYTALNRL